ncbi:hypothetical protein GN244_ATG08258 [Phytophthora infestans]|uniref:RxLR effector protein n=1 Tax=Phytophthora infestans TaxID=4787 RepID=A0A833SVL8_PHYIN|nr:hypothetical protein GN244_ATG08258 [Phytophthora infestans]KAF4138645.1 hypothetical protein GN958_ATG12150 [Phytophthora infestans]
MKSDDDDELKSDPAAVEERGFLSSLGLTVDISQLSDEKLLKVLLPKDAKREKVFKKLASQGYDGTNTYFELGGTKRQLNDFKLQFFKEYGQWHDHHHML